MIESLVKSSISRMSSGREEGVLSLERYNWRDCMYCWNICESDMMEDEPFSSFDFNVTGESPPEIIRVMRVWSDSGAKRA